MYAKDISKCCDALVRNFADNHSAFGVEFFENEAQCSWAINFSLLELEFIYAKKGGVLLPVSTLYCRIYLNKNIGFYFHIPQLIDYLDLDDFRCYYFMYIENEERLKACFDVLSGFFVKNYSALEKLAVSDSDYIDRLEDELKRVGKLKNKDFPENKQEREQYILLMLDVLSSVQLMRYCGFSAYDSFLSGNYEKALKEYKKSERRNEPLFYEKRLIDFIAKIKDNEEPYEALSKECASRFDVLKYNGTSKADSKTFILSIFLCLVAITVPIAIIMAIVNYYYNSTTLLNDAINPANAVMFAALPAIFGGIGISNKVQFLFHKNKKQATDFTQLLNPPKVFNTAIIISIVLLVGVMILYVLSFQPYIKCYDDYMAVNISNEFLSSDYRTEKYEDIKAIYHIDGRYNPYGDYIGRGSYILCFENQQFDTDSFSLSDDKIENRLLPLFDDYVDEIQYVHTEKDIK